MTTLINPALDASGNGNHWNPININFYTTDSTYDLMVDAPVVTEDASNYATLNAVNQASNTITNGNLKTSFSYHGGNRSTIGMSSGKWYWEVLPTTCPNFTVIGIAPATAAITADLTGTTENCITYLSHTGYWWRNNTGTAYGASYTASDTIGIALDVDNNSITFYKNGVSQGAITSVTLTGNTWFACIGNAASSATVGEFNFGQRPFAYTPPTGFVALNTFNLPTPTIGATASTQANKYFDATLYTGNGGTNTIVNAGGFQPDLVWAKDRGLSSAHRLVDAVRGVTKSLFSNLTDAEATESGLTAFNSNGFTVGSAIGMNYNTEPFVAWQWRASNTTPVSNTAGSITSTVSANTSAGFSVVTYTGNGSTGATVGHGLGVAPAMIIVKKRSSTGNWITYHTGTGLNQYLYLNSTMAAATATPTWGVSSTTVTFQQSFGDYNDSGVTYVMYAFAEVAGYSKFGSYTGNGSSDSPFLYCGFKPRYIMFKMSSSTQNWLVFDSARSTYNQMGDILYPNLSSAEYVDSNKIDFLSNGVKIRSSQTDLNSNGGTYIYMAFAENPYKYSLAR
jgi:hypothetical protein